MIRLMVKAKYLIIMMKPMNEDLGTGMKRNTYGNFYEREWGRRRTDRIW